MREIVRMAYRQSGSLLALVPFVWRIVWGAARGWVLVWFACLRPAGLLPIEGDVIAFSGRVLDPAASPAKYMNIWPTASWRS